MKGSCPNFDLHRHVLVTGGTGCGKTASVVLPLLARCLAQGQGNPEKKAALLVVDVKGDLTGPVRRLAATHGRSDDIIEIASDSPHVADLFSEIGRDPHAGSQLIVGANWARAGSTKIGGDNAYWDLGAQGYIASAIAWLRLLEQPCTPEHLIDLLSGTGASRWKFSDGRTLSVPVALGMVEKLGGSADGDVRRLAVLLRRLTELTSQSDARTRGVFTSILAQVIEPLAHPLSRLIATYPVTWTPESWLSEGRILLVRLPFVTEPGPSNYVARFIKLSLQRLVLSRRRPDLAGCDRPCYFVFDEAHRFITSDQDTGDQYFVDRCRAMNTGCIYATQSVSALQSLLVESQLETFLANINSRVFGRTLDRPTAELAATLLGDVDWLTDYRGSRLMLSPDPDPDVPPQSTFPAHAAGDRRVSPADLAQLATGEFYVMEGGKTYRWEATLDEPFREPELIAASRPPAIPAWTSLPELAEFADKLRAAPAAEAEATPKPDDWNNRFAGTPEEKTGDEGKPGARYNRPAWLDNKAEAEENKEDDLDD